MSSIIVISILNLIGFITSSYLETETFMKPKLEKNKILNKGVWIKRTNNDQPTKTVSGDFVFRSSSLDADSLLLNNFDAFGENFMQDSPMVPSYIERSKRSADGKALVIYKLLPYPAYEQFSKEYIENSNSTDLLKSNISNDKVITMKSKLITHPKLVTASNDYPYEEAILLTNTNKRELIRSKIRSSKHESNKNISNTSTDLIFNRDNLVKLEDLSKKHYNNTYHNFNVTPKRSMQQDYESEIIKKIGFTEEVNKTEDSYEKKNDRNVFEGDDRAWHQNAPVPDVNSFKILPKNDENKNKNKPITEKGLIKVLSMLTKTFKKVMKQHNDIKRIHTKLSTINDEFMKNAQLLMTKFNDFDVKYLYLMKFNENLKDLEARLRSKEELYNNKEVELTKNLAEFENQQKKFLIQQRQFYNIQKLMLAQNEKINLKQNLIAKTQNEISLRQNNFARILKKAKQIYIDAKNPIPQTLNAILSKPNDTSENKTNNIDKSISTTSTQTPNTESVKINLLSVPSISRIINYDNQLLKEKDDHTVDDLIYKYYFNNTYIDVLMKNKILSSFVSSPGNPFTRNVKGKRNDHPLFIQKTTNLFPVNNNPVKHLNREKRWIKNSKRNIKKLRMGKDFNIYSDKDNVKTNPNKNNVSLDKQIGKTSAGIKTKKSDKDPFITMATSFCKEIGQDGDEQMLHWCVEKALRRLRFLADMKIPRSTVTAKRSDHDGVTPIQSTTLQKDSKIKEMSTVFGEISSTTPSASNTDYTITVPAITAAQYTTASGIFFPELKPDTEGTVYYDGSVHASQIDNTSNLLLKDIKAYCLYMTRCDYDGVFYRVFCVTLLATAFTFTVILTNVFIDIDGLLSKKENVTFLDKQNDETAEKPSLNLNGDNKETTDPPFGATLESIYDNNYIDDQPETPHRTKRSLDSSNFLTHLKNPKIKKVLTTRLAKLLEQLDKEEDSIEDTYKSEKSFIAIDDIKKSVEDEYIKYPSESKLTYDNEGESNKKDDKDLLHLAMHNILLQGIIGHMDLNEVYKKINKLEKKFSNGKNMKGFEPTEQVSNKINQKTSYTVTKVTDLENSSDVETKFFDELVKCKKLQEEIMRRNKKNEITTIKTTPFQKDPKVSFKTIIEIKSLIFDKDRKENNGSLENRGVLKIIYNDKILNDHQAKTEPLLEDENRANRENNLSTDKQISGALPEQYFKSRQSNNTSNGISDSNKYLNDSYYFQQAVEYLKKHSFHEEQLESLPESVDKNDTKRLKRHIKIRYDEYDETTPKNKPVRISKKSDDNLYVEIETHFDRKSLKGEKKKKLVRNLIDRIQKAIRSDVYSHENNNNKKVQKVQIKKRNQNPLKHKHSNTLKKYIMQRDPVEHRQLNPISKALLLNDLSHDLEVKSEENGNRPNYSPIFFTPSYLGNSAEMSNTNSEYNNVLNSGIPQRLQVPLNTDITNSAKSQNTYADTGNVTLFIKDIDGSGFSVGFNQYVDEPPDVESMKLFSGLENLIRTYHENYDQSNNENTDGNDINNSIERYHELTKRNIDLDRNEHILLRRSIQELDNEDYHSNAYKIIFDKKVIPYETYHDILQLPNQRTLSSNYEYKSSNYDYNPKNIKIITKDIKIKELPLGFMGNNIFKKELMPSKILTLGNLFNRKKRSLNVKKFTNLKSKIKVNRYLNTKSMQTKKIFLKNKRNKREIDKIRIIASDHMPHTHKNSDENIFVVSGENLFTNRAVLKEIELPESDTGDDVIAEESNDEAIPYTYEESNPETGYLANIFGAKSTHNGLMAKYPHIFTDDITGSKQIHFGRENEYNFLRGSNTNQFKLEKLLGMRVTTENSSSVERDVAIPEIVNAIMPSPSKSNYKVTVKILPKNLTNAHSGFKEMHTVINKTYNKNGLQYISLVNVSEISKIEKINKTKDLAMVPDKKDVTSTHIQEEENRIKLLLEQQKKKIEQQLEQLNKEKEGLETILRERVDNKQRRLNDILKHFMHLETQKKNDDLKFINDPFNSILQIQNLASNEHSTTSSSIATAKVTNDETLCTKSPHDELKKDEKERLTNEILSKINQNTDILQCFLLKLTEKLNTKPPVQSTTNPTHVEKVTEKAQHLRSHADLGLNLNNMHDTIFGDHIPSSNDSHYAIPFVYAYQHPYLPPNKPPLPMAKVVYHGHIHTNAIHKHPNELWKNNINNSKANHITTNGNPDNGTRFFIDALANDFGVIPPKQFNNTIIQ
ncbi:unnamed protein product [Parnassius apollo]|uniref:(apollo) hypothetical protein n=1 Tax=Parnassius apollo TaxID=110799 RepID=A0A8S3W9K5_PARAO|nr:unnamed protein product [Parnassius apollo]